MTINTNNSVIPQPSLNQTTPDLNLQPPLHPNILPRGTVEVLATPAPTGQRINATNAASMTPDRNPRLWKYELKDIVIGHQKYTLYLDYPLEKPFEQLTPQEKMQVKDAAEECAKYLVEDLRITIDNQEKVKAGDNIRILFQGDEGYLVTKDDGKLTSLDSAAIDRLKADENTIKATTDQSKALSAAIGAGSVQSTLNTLEKSPKLETLRTKVHHQKTLSAKAALPVNLKNSNNACFLSAAFQQLVTDPLLFDELSDPANFKDGVENKLYKAIQAYRNHQISQNTTKIDIANILGIDTSSQMDSLTDGWNKLADFLNFADSNADTEPCISESSKLYALFKEPVFVNIPNPPDPQQTLDALLANSNAFANKSSEELPEVMSVQVQNRVEWPKLSTVSNLITELSEPLRKKILEILTKREPLEQNIDEDGFGDPCPTETEYQNAFNLSEFIHRNNGTLDKALDDRKMRSLILEFLDEREKILLTNAINSIAPTKNSTPLQINNTTVQVKAIPYEIAGFVHHSGEAATQGHYTQYFRRDGKFYKLNDQSARSPQVITEALFLQAAKQASYYTLHKQEIVNNNPNPRNGQEQSQPENQVENGIQIENTSTNYSLETGTMSAVQEDFVLINPSNKGLHNIHPQMDNLVKRETIIRQINTELAAINSGTFRFGPFKKSELTFEPRDDNRWTGPAPTMLLGTNSGRSMIHIPLKPNPALDDVKQAVTDVLRYAMERKKTKIAFPVFQISGKSAAEVVESMQIAIEAFVQAHPEKWREGHIKIIEPLTVSP